MRKNGKKLLSWVLVFCMTALLFTACGGQDEKETQGSQGTQGSQETGSSGSSVQQSSEENPGGEEADGEREVFKVVIVRFNDVWSTDFLEAGVFKELEDKFNIDIQWDIYTTAEWAEKKSAMFLSGDLPDAFFGSQGMSESDYVNNPEYFVELSDKIPNMPNLSKVLEADPELRYRITEADGSIYSLPKRLPLRPSSVYNLFINQTWLDNLGLDMPETYEDLANVLKAFAEQDANGNGDPTDEIPYSAMMNAYSDLIEIASCFGTVVSGAHNGFALDENKNPIFMPIQDKYKEAVKWLRGLWEDGCLDPEAYTQDSSMYYSKNQVEGGCRVGMVWGWDVATEVGQEYAKEFVALPPVTGPDGEKYCHYDPSSYDVSACEFAVTYKCKNPDKLLQWADEFYTDDVTIQTYCGYFGMGCQKNEDGTYLVLPDPDATFAWCYGTRDFGPKWMSPEAQEKVTFDEDNSDYAKMTNDSLYKPYVRDYNCAMPILKYTEEQMDALSEVQGDILSFCRQMHSHWVMEGGIEEEWDDYLAQLDQMGLQRYLDIIQEAYDNYLESMNNLNN